MGKQNKTEDKYQVFMGFVNTLLKMGIVNKETKPYPMMIMHKMVAEELELL